MLQRPLGPCGVSEFAFVVIVQHHQPKRRPRRAVPSTCSISSSPLVLPAERMGRRPIRFQMRTGFSGPSSSQSSAGWINRSPCPSAAIELQTLRAADDAFGRDAVDRRGDGPHEVTATARHDVAGEAVCLEVTQQFDHRGVDALLVRTFQRGVGGFARKTCRRARHDLRRSSTRAATSPHRQVFSSPNRRPDSAW